MQKVKRGKKCDAGDTTHKLLKGNEVTVQRLSSEVSGKAQKYARIGLREFVPFTEDELTIKNIKRCCERHFAVQLGTSVVCDILAGERGPSSKTLEQIPDMKVIYVRFVTGNMQEVILKGHNPIAILLDRCQVIKRHQ